MTIQDAIDDLRRGRFVMIHDDGGRENEYDLMVAAQFMTPKHVSKMRKDAGGLLCLALEHNFATSLGLEYMHKILENSSVPSEMILGRARYGDHPTFSIGINHIDTYTGVTDTERAHTIHQMSELYNNAKSVDRRTEFVRSFRTPGHVPLLIASDGLLRARRGHTEMSVYLSGLAGLRPMAAICEMMDSSTHLALKKDEARKFAQDNSICIVEFVELLEGIAAH